MIGYLRLNNDDMYNPYEVVDNLQGSLIGVCPSRILSVCPLTLRLFSLPNVDRILPQ
jgi:hypothetical protein